MNRSESYVSQEESASDPLNLFFTIDDGFSMPLAVVLQSALQNLTSVNRVQIVVAGTDLRPKNRRKLSRIVERAPVDASIDFVTPDTSVLSGFPTTQWHGLPVYFRLLIDRLVPSDWTHALYLDADMLVRGDLGALWRRPLNGNVALGVQSFRVPTVSQRLSLRDAYFNDLGLPPETVYCNTGMMVIDLETWRKENIGVQCLDFLRAYSSVAEYIDQDAINGVLRGRWELVESTWNVALSAVPYYGFPDHELPEHRAQQINLKRDPKIVHFSGPSKPWHFLYRRPLSGEFFEYLVGSQWFALSEQQRWIEPRRLAHGALRLVPKEMLVGTKQALDGAKRWLKH